LHRFLIKVEGVGGDHELGVNALINDRRMWLERVDDYKKEKSAVVKEIIISCLFSSIICAITMYMLPSYVGSMKHIISRIGSTVYIIVNQFTVAQTLKHTVFYLNDTYTEEEEMALLTKFRWFKTWDKKVETKKGLKPAIMMVFIGIVALFLGYWWMMLICVALAAFSYFVQPIMKHNGARKSITREIEKAYPDWLLELSLLLQTENLHVALEKTLDTSPRILQDDLIQLGDDIASYPTEVFPYTNFLHDINVSNIHSSMKLLYSIATYGSEEEEKQIAELVERNASLMNKAEQVKNTDRLAKVYIYKFIPMAASALKLICDMAVFLIMFISQSLSAL
jgi:ABC-type multidrug transport system fused ATPase/permease subunit